MTSRTAPLHAVCRPLAVGLLSLGLGAAGAAGAAPVPGAAPAAAAPLPDPRIKAAHAAGLERSSRFTPPAPRMDPVLSRAALDRMAAEGRSALWVVFTDKGIADARAFETAVREAGGRLTERARARLREIDDALARMEAGRYGISVRSGDPIDYDRLKAVPWARLRADEE